MGSGWKEGMKDNVVGHEGWRVGHEGQCSRA